MLVTDKVILRRPLPMGSSRMRSQRSKTFEEDEKEVCHKPNST